MPMTRTKATFAPPVMEASRWLEGVSFSTDVPLIDVSQAAPAAPPPTARPLRTGCGPHRASHAPVPISVAPARPAPPPIARASRPPAHRTPPSPPPAACPRALVFPSHLSSPGMLTRTYLVRTQVSEDCLSLNIWSPAGSNASSSLPVIVYIHGGAFINGDASLYPGNTMAAESNVVVVSIQYRLNVFGFFALDDADGVESNFGLRDQQLALTWVQGNIESFGGDPSRGESERGRAVARVPGLVASMRWRLHRSPTTCRLVDRAPASAPCLTSLPPHHRIAGRTAAPRSSDAVGSVGGRYEHSPPRGHARQQGPLPAIRGRQPWAVEVLRAERPRALLWPLQHRARLRSAARIAEAGVHARAARRCAVWGGRA